MAAKLLKLTDPGVAPAFNVGQLMSPTAPRRHQARLLDEMRPEIPWHGPLHGGAQTQITPPRWRNSLSESGPHVPKCRLSSASSTTARARTEKCTRSSTWDTVWRSTSVRRWPRKIHRLQQEAFNIDAQVVGHIEEGKRSLTIQSEFGTFDYE